MVALHRELLVELGVSAELGPEVMPDGSSAWPLTGTATMRLWLARIVDGDPVPLEDHDELRWLPIGEWLSVPWLPADIAVVRELERRFSGPRSMRT